MEQQQNKSRLSISDFKKKSNESSSIAKSLEMITGDMMASCHCCTTVTIEHTDGSKTSTTFCE